MGFQDSGFSKHLRRRRRRRYLKWLLIISLLTILSTAAYSYLWAKGIEKKIQFEPKTAKKIAEVTVEPKKDKPINILLAGVDRRPNEKSGRADTIALLRIDSADKSAYLLSIPRDMRVTIPGRGLDKINHAWAFGGAPLLIKTVQDFLDLPVNYFFQVDFVSFQKVVDAIGGVDFTIDRGWYDGELGAAVRSGTYRRSGKEALAIVRARYQFAGGDAARIRNQQLFLMTVMKESLTSYSQVPQIAGIISQDSRTNMDLSTMIQFGQAFVGTQDDLQMQTVPGKGTMINKVYYLIPDQKAKESLVSDMINKRPFPAYKGSE